MILFFLFNATIDDLEEGCEDIMNKAMQTRSRTIRAETVTRTIGHLPKKTSHQTFVTPPPQCEPPTTEVREAQKKEGKKARHHW